MQLAHTPGAITFALRISSHVSKAKPSPDHPVHMPKLACAKLLGMSSSSLHTISTPIADPSHG